VNDDPEVSFALALIAAALAHLYIAWIHPFGDGNGRTARLLEFVLLIRSGRVPFPAAHLLSNHYNLTRDRYYRELDKASRTGGQIASFVGYAIEGFVDGLRSQIDAVRAQHLQVIWDSYVSAVMSDFPVGKARDRQIELVHALGYDADGVRRADITGLTPSLAAQYALAGPRTLARDINRLESAGLVRVLHAPGARTRVAAQVDQMSAFMPPRATGAERP
jgi:Fic/DOC family